MIVDPAEIHVTSPVDGLTDALPGFKLFQTPPGIPPTLVRNTEEPTQKVDEGAGTKPASGGVFTVTE